MLGCSEKQEQSQAEHNINSIVIGDFFINENIPLNKGNKNLSSFSHYISDYFTKKSNYKTVLRNFPSMVSYFSEKSDANKTLPTSLLKLDDDYVLMGAIESFSLSRFRGNKLKKNVLQVVSKKQLILESYVSIMLVNLKTKQTLLKENIRFEKVFKDTSVENILYSDIMAYMSDVITSKVLLKLAGKIKVIAVQDNQVVLNRGHESGILEGMDFELISNRQLDGRDVGLKVADIKIVRVDDNVSFGSLVRIENMPKVGDFAKIAKQKKPKITNEKIRIMLTNAVFDNKNIKENLLAKYINTSLSNKIGNNQNFIITNNKNNNLLLIEQIIDDFSKNRSTKMPIGSFRGADFVVFNNIEYLIFDEEKIEIDILSAIDVAVLEKKPSRVKLSGHSYMVDVNTGNKIANAKSMFTLEFGDDLQNVEKLKMIADKYAQDIYEKLVEVLTPTRILKHTNGLFVLNHGSNEGISKGDIFDIYGKSEIVKDEYTDMSLELSGIKIGAIRIIDFTKTNNAVASLISGSYEVGAKVSKRSEQAKAQSTTKSKKYKKIDKNKKKKNNYLIVDSLKVNNSISKYKTKLVKKFDIDAKLASKINNSKLFRVLSRDKSQIHSIINEKAIAKSKISANNNLDALKLLVADYILIPKLIDFQGYTSSKKIDFIESFENKDFLQLTLELTLLDMQGQVLYTNTAREKYFNSWASDSKIKRSFPVSSRVNETLEKVLNESINKLVSNKVEIFSQGLLAVVEVGERSIFLDIASENIKSGSIINIYDEPRTKLIKRTGKSVMIYGSKVAMAKVISVNDGIAEAQIIDGSIKEIKENFIAKREQ